MTPQQFICLFLIIPGILLISILLKFLRMFLYVDTDTITATCVSRKADPKAEVFIEPSNEETSFVTYTYNGDLYKKRKLSRKYDTLTVGENVQIYIDEIGRPRQEIDFDKEIVSLGIYISVFVGLILYFMNILLPTVHRGW